MGFHRPATINTPSEEPAPISNTPPSSVITYEDYLRDIESMCNKDKEFMLKVRQFCEEKADELHEAHEHPSKSEDGC